MSQSPVQLSYFSDVLCIWAYVGQIRLDELKQQFGERIQVEQHFITLFGCTESRIGQGWQAKGGYQGFGQHVCEVAAQFPHVEINPNVWQECRPKSSAMAHLVLKALQLHCRARQEDDAAVAKLAHAIREAFFLRGEDIGQSEVLRDLIDAQGLPLFDIQDYIDDGSAMAALMADMALKEQHKLEGSPTYLLNNGRQKLFGNVGYRVIEANVQELLEHPENCASWC